MARLSHARGVHPPARSALRKQREIPINVAISSRDVADKLRKHVTDIELFSLPHQSKQELHERLGFTPGVIEKKAAAILEVTERRQALQDAEKVLERQRLERLTRQDAEIERDTRAHPALRTTPGTGKTRAIIEKKKQSTPQQKAERAAKEKERREKQTIERLEKVRDLRIARLQDKLVKKGWNKQGAWSEACDVVKKEMDQEREEISKRIAEKVLKKQSSVQFE